MRIATLSFILACLLFVPDPPGAARPPWSETWFILPETIPPFTRAPSLAADPSRNLYFHGPEGIFRVEEGRLRAMPSPAAAGFRIASFLPLSGQDYWVHMIDSGSWAEARRLLFRYRSGQWTRYDSTTPCSRGELLGLDAGGNPLLELRTNGLFATKSQGVFRLAGGRCEAVPLGLGNPTELLATRYFRDSRGREYFGLNRTGDVPLCAGFLRLGDSLERFESIELERDSLGLSVLRVPICARDFAESGDTVFVASSPGLGILVDTAFRMVRGFRGIIGRGAEAVHRDARGYLWLGMEGYESDTAHLGLVRIKGGDTLSMHKGNSDLPSFHPGGLWEDESGNLWVRMKEGGLAVLLGEGNPQPLGLARRDRPWLPRRYGIPGPARDYLGRRIAPARRPED